MTRARQKNRQQELAFPAEAKGEAPSAAEVRVELVKAVDDPESPAATERMMEVICERENLSRALKRVTSNKGAAGVDGMTVKELPKFLKRCWPSLREQLLEGTYQPKPVRRVEIEKSSGGTRKLGIPCVVDRFIQQAVLQVLQPQWDPTFSDHSYGFRPGRSAHQAVARTQQYVGEGYDYVVDIDLEQFFDRVNHDMLMARVARRVPDKRVLRLIRAYLNAGIMEEGLIKPPEDEGVPQGGPLSPLLSNLFLDEFDRELERRGHRFVRYADDVNIYVRTERAGHRVMEGLKGWIGKKLRLRFNERKSKVARVNQSKFLGFTISVGREPRRRISKESLDRFKARVRQLTRRSRGRSLVFMIRELSSYLRGWLSYYGFTEQVKLLKDLDSWIRRRLRSYLWTQWKTYSRRRSTLEELGLKRSEAARLAYAGCRLGPWVMSKTTALHMALSNRYFRMQGLFSLSA
jgi:RNA-directed DNA polymerase